MTPSSRSRASSICRCAASLVWVCSLRPWAKSCWRLPGRTYLSMISQLVGAVVNIILDPIFIFGYCGEALSGTTGAAVATVIGQFCGAGMTLYFNTRKKPGYPDQLQGLPAQRQGHRPHLHRGSAQHRHAVRGQPDDLWHEPDPDGLLRYGGGGVRRVLQAAELRVHAGVRPEQRHGAHHQLQLRCPQTGPRRKRPSSWPCATPRASC